MDKEQVVRDVVPSNFPNRLATGAAASLRGAPALLGFGGLRSARASVLAALVATALLIGCADSAPAPAAAGESAAAVQSLSAAAPAPAAPGSESSMSDMTNAASSRMASTGLEPVVVRVAANDPSVAAAVGYRPGGPDAPPECALMVFAANGGALATVETSAQLIDCSAHPTAEGMAEAIELDVQAQRIALFYQGDKRNARFEFVRRADGRWIVVAARFTSPEYDADADEMRVFTDSVAYAAEGKQVLVSDYRYAVIEPDLQRKEVE